MDSSLPRQSISRPHRAGSTGARCSGAKPRQSPSKGSKSGLRRRRGRRGRRRRGAAAAGTVEPSPQGFVLLQRPRAFGPGACGGSHPSLPADLQVSQEPAMGRPVLLPPVAQAAVIGAGGQQRPAVAVPPPQPGYPLTALAAAAAVAIGAENLRQADLIERTLTALASEWRLPRLGLGQPAGAPAPSLPASRLQQLLYKWRPLKLHPALAELYTQAKAKVAGKAVPPKNQGYGYRLQDLIDLLNAALYASLRHLGPVVLITGSSVPQTRFGEAIQPSAGVHDVDLAVVYTAPSVPFDPNLHDPTAWAEAQLGLRRQANAQVATAIHATLLAFAAKSMDVPAHCLPPVDPAVATNWCHTDHRPGRQFSLCTLFDGLDVSGQAADGVAFPCHHPADGMVMTSDGAFANRARGVDLNTACEWIQAGIRPPWEPPARTPVVLTAGYGPLRLSADAVPQRADPKALFVRFKAGAFGVCSSRDDLSALRTWARAYASAAAAAVAGSGSGSGQAEAHAAGAPSGLALTVASDVNKFMRTLHPHERVPVLLHALLDLQRLTETAPAQGAGGIGGSIASAVVAADVVGGEANALDFAGNVTKPLLAALWQALIATAQDELALAQRWEAEAAREGMPPDTAVAVLARVCPPSFSTVEMTCEHIAAAAGMLTLAAMLASPAPGAVLHENDPKQYLRPRACAGPSEGWYVSSTLDVSGDGVGSEIYYRLRLPGSYAVVLVPQDVAAASQWLADPQGHDGAQDVGWVGDAGSAPSLPWLHHFKATVRPQLAWLCGQLLTDAPKRRVAAENLRAALGLPALADQDLGGQGHPLRQQWAKVATLLEELERIVVEPPPPPAPPPALKVSPPPSPAPVTVVATLALQPVAEPTYSSVLRSPWTGRRVAPRVDGFAARQSKLPKRARLRHRRKSRCKWTAQAGAGKAKAKPKLATATPKAKEKGNANPKRPPKAHPHQATPTPPPPAPPKSRPAARTRTPTRMRTRTRTRTPTPTPTPAPAGQPAGAEPAWRGHLSKALAAEGFAATCVRPEDEPLAKIFCLPPMDGDDVSERLPWDALATVDSWADATQQRRRVKEAPPRALVQSGALLALAMAHYKAWRRVAARTRSSRRWARWFVERLGWLVPERGIATRGSGKLSAGTAKSITQALEQARFHHPSQGAIRAHRDDPAKAKGGIDSTTYALLEHVALASQGVLGDAVAAAAAPADASDASDASDAPDAPGPAMLRQTSDGVGRCVALLTQRTGGERGGGQDNLAPWHRAVHLVGMMTRMRVLHGRHAAHPGPVAVRLLEQLRGCRGSRVASICRELGQSALLLADAALAGGNGAVELAALPFFERSLSLLSEHRCWDTGFPLALAVRLLCYQGVVEGTLPSGEPVTLEPLHARASYVLVCARAHLDAELPVAGQAPADRAASLQPRALNSRPPSAWARVRSAERHLHAHAPAGLTLAPNPSWLPAVLRPGWLDRLPDLGTKIRALAFVRAASAPAGTLPAADDRASWLLLDMWLDGVAGYLASATRAERDGCLNNRAVTDQLETGLGVLLEGGRRPVLVMQLACMMLSRALEREDYASAEHHMGAVLTALRQQLHSHPRVDLSRLCEHVWYNVAFCLTRGPQAVACKLGATIGATLRQAGVPWQTIASAWRAALGRVRVPDDVRANVHHRWNAVQRAVRTEVGALRNNPNATIRLVGYSWDWTWETLSWLGRKVWRGS